MTLARSAVEVCLWASGAAVVGRHVVRSAAENDGEARRGRHLLLREQWVSTPLFIHLAD